MRIEKIAILDEVVARVKDSDYCFIVNHGGVTVAQFAKLRKALKALDSRLLVVKNSFLGKVAKEKGWSEEVNAMLQGNTAIVTGHGEPTAVAKAIMEFVKDSGGKASVKGADYDNKIVDAAMVEALSKVPGKTSSAQPSSCSSRSLRHASRASSPRRPRRKAALPPRLPQSRRQRNNKFPWHEKRPRLN